MIIETSKVSPEGSLYEGEEPVAILNLEANPLIRLEGDIQYRLLAQVVSGELVVTGSLEVPLALKCSRCAEFFSTSLRDSSFLRAYDISGGVESVDLTPDIREDILLDLPSYPACSPDCKGLCSQCGKNLNQGPCTCPPPESGRWGALEGLDLK